jgi:hypothetical protein
MQIQMQETGCHSQLTDSWQIPTETVAVMQQPQGSIEPMEKPKYKHRHQAQEQRRKIFKDSKMQNKTRLEQGNQHNLELP